MDKVTRAQQLYGSWQLISYQQINANNIVQYPFGKDVLGYLIYTPDNFMSVTLSRANRPHLNIEDIVEADATDANKIINDFFSYCGRYEIAEAGQVFHIVEQCIFPNWIGTKQQRFAHFDEQHRLTLTSPPALINGILETDRLLWQRIE